MQITQKRILLVEDENVTAKHYISVLEREGFAVVRAASGMEALRIAESGAVIDLILTDIVLGDGMDGVETAGAILKTRNIPVVFHSIYTGAEIVEKATKVNSYGFVVKNTGDSVLMAAIKMAFRLHEANMSINTQKQEIEAVNEEMLAAMEELESINLELVDTQRDLLKSESELRSLFNALLVGAGMIVDRKFFKVNSYLCSLLGYDESELIGKLTKTIYIDDEEYKRVGCELYGMMLREGHGITKARIRHKEGHILDALISLTPVDPGNMDAGVCATINDITELNRAETALRESENKFKAIMEQSTLPMLILDCNGTMVDANDAWAKLWNADKSSVIGKYNIFTDPQNIHAGGYVEQALRGEPADFPEHSYDPAQSGVSGEKRWITGRVYPLRDHEGNVKNVVMLLEDITDRRMAEEALRLSEEKFRNIYETMNMGFFRTGPDGRLLDLNPACLRIFDFSTIDEARIYLNDSSEGVYAESSDWERVRKAMTTGNGEFRETVRLKKRDGTEFRGSLNMKVIRTSEGRPLYIEGLIEDVTEREKTQEMLIQSEKMITVAGLAAGMAHEINNPLGIIMQNAENALHRMLDDLPGNVDAALSVGTDLQKIQDYARARRIDQYLTAIRDAGVRAAKIVSNMLKFSRGTESKFDYLNINTIMDKALDLASNDYDLRKNYDFRNIRIIKNYGELPDIPCSEIQIEQVFLNILKNAAEAMFNDESASGKEHIVWITTSGQNGYVKIEIQDNGPGMAESTRKRIFEPFFTVGKKLGGRGLGLSVSYYIIVTGHRGSISVESARGGGSLFTIALPVCRR